jgi:hypothetical protein
VAVNPAVVGSAALAAGNTGVNSAAAGEAVRCQRAGTAGGADGGEAEADGAPGVTAVDVTAVGVTAVGVTAVGVDVAPAADVPPVFPEVESSEVDAYRATPPTTAATATKATTSAMRRMRCLRPPLIYATLTNDRLLTVSP